MDQKPGLHKAPLLQDQAFQDGDRRELLLREERSDVLCESSPVYMNFFQKIDTRCIDINHLME